MPRIVYLAFPNGKLTGGQKMILRHVETLRDLGFDAVVRRNVDNVDSGAFDHRAPIQVGGPFEPDDILVLPSDAPSAIGAVARGPWKSLVFVQNQFDYAAIGAAAVAQFPGGVPSAFISVSPSVTAALARLHPGAPVEFIPAFADERIFKPAPAGRHDAIAVSPRKRRLELKSIQGFLAASHPRHTAVPWRVLENMRETDVAAAFRFSTVCLSLSRLEALGLTPLEAMASGCIVAGFTGVGGRDFATAGNGFWVAEDECDLAADALAQALDLVATGGPLLKAMRDAGHATAEQWSYARFRTALEDTWMRHAPQARISSGPLT
ncbi:glycosyltransferase [Phenylobacterium sp.]|jgi:hypothetical protein|uniref:glycosyltransferase n=1 Tax=Phenylobacterium sp. TaxID=1871053 RepID=UPI002F9407DD